MNHLLGDIRDWIDDHRAASLAALIALVVIVAVAARAIGDENHGKAAAHRSGVYVRVTGDTGVTSHQYALFGTLVKGTTDVVWTRRLDPGADIKVDEIGAGKHVLSLTVSPCASGDCDSYRGGASIGIVPLTKASDMRIDVAVKCTMPRARARSGRRAAPAVRLPRCEQSTVQQHKA